MIHFLRTAVGCPDLETLKSRQAAFHQRWPDGIEASALHTRRFPKRIDELLDGGSVYWIIKGQIQARQSILAIDAVEREESAPVCRIRMALPVIPVLSMTQRAVQGWRYLTVDKAPADLQSSDTADLPPSLVAELRDLGVW